GSLFELLDTARTETGEEFLAARLTTGASIEEIAERQAAVAELRAKVDFREDLAVLAAETEVSRTGSMARWGLSAPAGLTWTAAVVFAICALVTVAVAALAFAERLDVQYL